MGFWYACGAGNIENLLTESGVKEFVHAGQDMLVLLRALHGKLGIKQTESAA